MVEPEKPFACSLSGCGQTFTNEDHLQSHKKKHDMILQFGLEQKNAFVADQTPTPTRFIRNCEEVGLFQDLQNVNPFDEGFKRAMETKPGINSMGAVLADDTLHTPQMFPVVDGEPALFTATNNQRNITISRSSSDETGAIKEYEKTTISKLTNEVTTISRVVEKQDPCTKTDHSITIKDIVHENSVSYKNNVIKIHSNVEIRKDHTDPNRIIPIALVYSDSVVKDVDVKKDASETLPLPPIMSQRSLDYVVDSLNECKKTEDLNTDSAKRKAAKKVLKSVKVKDEATDCEVILTINGKKVRMQPVPETDTKEKLKNVLENKIKKEEPSVSVVRTKMINVPNILPLNGTLIPVNLVPKPIVLPVVQRTLHKVPIPNLKNVDFKVPRKKCRVQERDATIRGSDSCKGATRRDEKAELSCMKKAASKRYRDRLKERMMTQTQENFNLKEANKRLLSENVTLKRMVLEHLKICPEAELLKTSFAAENFKQ